MLLRRVRTAQPNIPVGVDWSNPLAKDLWALVGIDKSGPVEMVRRLPFGKTGAPVVKAGSNGLAVNATASSDTFFLTGLPDIPVDSGLTISILSEVDAQNITRKRAIRLSGSAGTIASIDYSDGSSQAYLFGVQKVGGSFATQAGTTAPYPLGTNLLTLVYTPGTNLPLSYENRLLQTGTNRSISGNFASTINAIYLANSSSGFPLNGKLYFAAVWTRALGDMEVKALSDNPWQIFKPRLLPVGGVTVTAQYARPTSDVSSGVWTASTGSDLYAMLDETTANDGDYIITTAASVCEVALGALSDPASSAGHVVRYRISATSGGIIVRLRQGTTTIATWTHSPAPSALTTYAQTLSGGEADSITNYAALKLQFEATP